MTQKKSHKSKDEIIHDLRVRLSNRTRELNTFKRESWRKERLHEQEIEELQQQNKQATNQIVELEKTVRVKDAQIKANENYINRVEGFSDYWRDLVMGKSKQDASRRHLRIVK